jgi:hypothetical protein
MIHFTNLASDGQLFNNPVREGLLQTTQNTQPPDSGSMSESAGNGIRKSIVQLFLLTKPWSSVYHHCHRG